MPVTTSIADIPTISVDFLDPRFAADPYPALEEIRAVGPIVRNERSGYLMLTSYADCAQVMGRAQSFAADVEHLTALFGGTTFASLSGARHRQLKGIWAPAFQRKSLAATYPELIRQVIVDRAADSIARLRAGETVDIAEGFVRAIPAVVIASMLGVPSADIPDFVRWSDEMGHILENRDDPSTHGRALVAQGKQATDNLNRYMAAVIDERRDRPGGDLVSQIAVSEVPMTEAEVVAATTQLVFAGNETTAKLMGHCLVTLAAHPGQREVLRQNRDLLPQAIEEVHRWSSVKVATLRFVREEQVQVAGHELAEDTTIMALPAAGNRDPQRWERADAFDINRPRLAHLGFGVGPHACLGLNLARLEVEILLNHLPRPEPGPARGRDPAEPPSGRDPGLAGAAGRLRRQLDGARPRGDRCRAGKRQGRTAMKINVDTGKCIGSGACVVACEEVFGLDDDGVVVVLQSNPPAELRERVHEAAEACPAEVIETTD
ncbi:cytochrome P450 [Saccharopolyspora spinosa]|nr:cytochrome P450 [Saccharopolyspora spinosa]